MTNRTSNESCILDILDVNKMTIGTSHDSEVCYFISIILDFMHIINCIIGAYTVDSAVVPLNHQQNQEEYQHHTTKGVLTALSSAALSSVPSDTPSAVASVTP